MGLRKKLLGVVVAALFGLVAISGLAIYGYGLYVASVPAMSGLWHQADIGAVLNFHICKQSGHMRRFFLIAIAAFAAAPAFAQEPVGCDKFRWPLDKERATLSGTDLPKVTSGSEVKWPLPFATVVALSPLVDAKLPIAPERPSKSQDTFGGYIQIAAPAKADTYRITLSLAGWIDVVQDGHRLRSSAATGATGCEGVRKSVKFELGASPFTVQLSGVGANTIGLVISGE